MEPLATAIHSRLTIEREKLARRADRLKACLAGSML
jgi:hypothetical protein